MNENKVCFVLQARMGSTRLPNKMIMPFYKNKTILEIIISKLKFNFPNIPIFLATSTHLDNDILEKIAIDNNCKVYRGSENDVLNRFISVAELYNIKKIIRVCCDNPFLDMSEMKVLLNEIKLNKTIDYISFKVNNAPTIKSHFGFWSEFVSIDALKKVESLAKDPFYHEHVTNYIYEHENLFSIKLLNVNSILEGKKDIRMTIDTISDFELASEIYSILFQEFGANFSIENVFYFLDLNKQYKFKMKEQIELNSK